MKGGENPPLPRNCERSFVSSVCHCIGQTDVGRQARRRDRKSGDRFSTIDKDTFPRGKRIMAVLAFLSLLLASPTNVFVVESPSYAKEMVVADRTGHRHAAG